MRTERKKKKLFAAAAAVTLAAALMIGGTFSYLTSKTEVVKNSFSTEADVDVDLTENSGQEYNIIPGTSETKDPTVTVTATVDAYVFLIVTDATDGLVTYSIDSTWTLMSDLTVTDEDGTTTYVYYHLLDLDSSDESAGEDGSYVYSVLTGNAVSYSAALTNADLEGAEGVTLSFQAYAIQAASFEDAQAAYDALFYEDVIDTEEELNEAIAAAESGDTITIGGDIALTDSVEISDISLLSIDLNGNDITNESGTVFEVSGSNLVIQDSSEGASGTITGTTDQNNIAGAIVITDGTVTMNSGTIADSTSTTDGSEDGSYTAGAVYVNGGQFVMNGGTIENCSAAGYMGAGAVYVTGSGQFTMNEGAVISDCSSTNSGSGNQYCAGAVIITGSSTFTLAGGSISGCTLGASNQYGTGGVFVDNSSTFVMSSGTITNCTGSRGGAVLVKGSTFCMNGGSISGNTATYSGGAVYIYNSGKMEMTGGSITGNTCSSGKGGGIRACSGTTVTISGGTISGNTASSGNNAYIDSGCTLSDSGDVLNDYINAN